VCKVETSPEAEVLPRVRVWVQQYLSKHRPVDVTDMTVRVKHAGHDGPVLLNGALGLRLNAFAEWVAAESGAMGSEPVKRDLRQVGFEATTVKVGETSRSYWLLRDWRPILGPEVGEVVDGAVPPMSEDGS
jgi:hypothetical protein